MRASASPACSSRLIHPPCPAPEGSLTPVWTDVNSPIEAEPFGPYPHQIVYDGLDHYFLAVVSPGFTPSESTWRFSGTGWQQFPTSGAVPYRVNEAVVYDPAIPGVVLFGGYNGTLHNNLNDTWVYRGSAWTNASGTGSVAPPPVSFASACFDPTLGDLVLYGGEYQTYSGTQVSSETWLFNSSGWHLLNPAGGVTPPRSAQGVLVYDPTLHSDLYFGGSSWTGSAPLDQSWVFNGTGWSNYSGVSASSPPGVTQSALVTDGPTLNGEFLWGGSAGAPNPFVPPPDTNATWAFQNGSWTNLTVSVGVPPRPAYSAGLLAYDPDGGFAMLFNGSTENWIFGPPVGLFANASRNSLDVGQTTHLSIVALSNATNLTYTYSGLPGGCSSANSTDLNCTPDQGGNFSVTVTAATPAGRSGSIGLWLNVSDDPTIVSLNATPDPLTLGNPTTILLTTSGGSAPLSVSYPALPPGCTAAPTLRLNCTASAAGNFTITARIADAAGWNASASVLLIVNAHPTVVAFLSNATLLDIGQSVSLSTVASGGTPPLSYAYAGLPPGCSSANAPDVACAPTSPGNYTVEVNVSDAFGWSARAALALSVFPAVALLSASMSPTVTEVGVPEVVALDATGGLAPLSYVAIGFPGACALGGSSTATCYVVIPGSFAIDLRATDRLGEHADAIVHLTVNPSTVGAVVITAGGERSEVGLTTNLTVEAVEGTGPFSYVIGPTAGSALPPGCVQVAAANLSCRWTSAGNYSVQGLVQDPRGVVARASLNLEVVSRLTLSMVTATPSAPLVGQQFEIWANASGGLEPYSYTYSGLPAGCAAANLSMLHCNTTTPGIYIVTLTVHDDLGAEAVGEVTVQVASATFGVANLVWDIGAVTIVAVAAVVIVLLRGARGRRARSGAQPGAIEPAG